MKEKPRSLTEDEVKLASEGKSKDVLVKSKPLPLSEDEVKLASEGKSKEVIEKKAKKSA